MSLTIPDVSTVPPVADEPTPDEPPTSVLEVGRVDWPTFWQCEHGAEDWLHEPILARGRGHNVTAPAKTGKSLLMLAIAAECATRTGVNIGYFDYEMTADDLHQRLTDLGYGPSSDLSHLHYIHNYGIPPLDTRAGGDAILEYVTLHEIEFVFIDSFARAVDGPENEADTVRAFYRYTGSRLKQRGIGWARLDNTGHDKSRTRGSAAKADDVDIDWLATKTDDGLKLTRKASRVPWVPERVYLRIAENPLRYVVAPLGYVAGAADAAGLLDRLEVPVDVSVRKAREALNDAGESITNAVLGDAVRYRKSALDAFRNTSVTPISTPHGTLHVTDPTPTQNPQKMGTEHCTERVVTPDRVKAEHRGGLEDPGVPHPTESDAETGQRDEHVDPSPRVAELIRLIAADRPARAHRIADAEPLA